jgi:hypothetical protein
VPEQLLASLTQAIAIFPDVGLLRVRNVGDNVLARIMWFRDKLLPRDIQNVIGELRACELGSI